jgi:thiamine-phosphate pyrophosphorylase
MKKHSIDYSLYLVTDRTLSRGRSTLEVIQAAIQGGVTCVQLREKSCSTREFIEEARAIKGFLSASAIPLIINDRVDIALAIEADGVHLGQTDMPLVTARSIVGADMIIGISAECLQDAVEAERLGADYLGVSPIYDTPTKTDTAPSLGLKGLRRIRSAVKLPLVGIGGLNLTNAAEVVANGTEGVAVVSAIVSAENCETAARQLRDVIDRAKQVRKKANTEQK